MSDLLTEKIIGAAIEVHRELGPGLLETIYEQALFLELSLAGVRVEQQVYHDVIYKGHILTGQRIDLLVEKEVVVEIKAVGKLPEIALAQALSYLKATGLRRGLLLNFGLARMVDGVKRIIV
jgi:GxxExxY protein